MLEDWKEIKFNKYETNDFRSKDTFHLCPYNPIKLRGKKSLNHMIP